MDSPPRLTVDDPGPWSHPPFVSGHHPSPTLSPPLLHQWVFPVSPYGAFPLPFFLPLPTTTSLRRAPRPPLRPVPCPQPPAPLPLPPVGSV